MKNIQALVDLVCCTRLDYNENAKKEFHRLGKLVARKIAKDLGLVKGTYSISSNMGGIAVSGEITLHAQDIYIQFSQNTFLNLFMYRYCNGPKDFTGGINRWMHWKQLLDYSLAISMFKIAQSKKV